VRQIDESEVLADELLDSYTNSYKQSVLDSKLVKQQEIDEKKEEANRIIQ